MRGAPIRFVAVVLGGWTCVRIAVLLPDAERREIAGALAPPAAATGRPVLRKGAVWPRPPVPLGSMYTPERRSASSPPPAAITHPAAIGKSNAVSTAGDTGQDAVAPILVAPMVGQAPAGQPENRWTASAWLLVRGGANGTLSGGRLGASQAGVRTTYLFDQRRRLALAGRIATPLSGRGTEAAIGLDWQPTSAPVHLVVEQRIAIDGARGGPTAMVIAGLDPTPVGAGFRLEAYAQAGAILRDGRAQAFGDGAARLTRPVAALGRTTIDLGLGAWGAGQPGAARVDVGPTIGAALPVAGRSLRLSLDCGIM